MSIRDGSEFQDFNQDLCFTYECNHMTEYEATLVREQGHHVRNFSSKCSG